MNEQEDRSEERIAINEALASHALKHGKITLFYAGDSQGGELRLMEREAVGMRIATVVLARVQPASSQPQCAITITERQALTPSAICSELPAYINEILGDNTRPIVINFGTLAAEPVWIRFSDRGSAFEHGLPSGSR